MKLPLWLVACVFAGAWAGGAARAQPSVPPAPGVAASPSATTSAITLRDALESAWQRAVSSRQAAAQQRRADADRALASSPWASPPALVLSHRNDRLFDSAGKRETEVEFAVPLWLPGQRAARASTAEAAAAQARAAEEVARLHLAGELREAAWQLAALGAELAQAEVHALALRQLAADVERRVGAGDLARADSLAAEAEHYAAVAAQADVRQRLHAARARWVLLTGQPALPDVALPGLAERAAADPASATQAAHPELRLAEQATELARWRAELVRRSRRDAPELTVGVRQDVPGRNEAPQGSLVVGLRWPLGTDDRNRPLEAQALSELDVAQTHELRLRERLDSDLTNAREAQQSAQGQLEAETARARLLRERARLIEKSFRAGESPLPDLLRALATAAQADSAVARQTAARGLARARLQQALGLLP